MSQTLAMVAAWGAEPPYERGLWDWANPNSSKIGVSLQTSTESGARGPFATGVRRPALNARDRRLRRRPSIGVTSQHLTIVFGYHQSRGGEQPACPADD